MNNINNTSGIFSHSVMPRMTNQLPQQPKDSSETPYICDRMEFKSEQDTEKDIRNFACQNFVQASEAVSVKETASVMPCSDLVLNSIDSVVKEGFVFLQI